MKNISAAAGLLAIVAWANALSLVRETAYEPSVSLMCEAQINVLCPAKQTLRSELLFEGVVNKFTCLTQNQARLTDDCFLSGMDSTLDFIVEKHGDKCKDELRSKCGKQIDELKKAVQDTSVIGVLKGAVDVVECIVSHAEDLWDHCKPQKHEEVKEATVIDDCADRAAALCEPTQHKVLGLGYTLGCVAGNVDKLGAECTRAQMLVAIEDMESADDKTCHDELRKKCGKQIDQLKKEIQDTSILGILKSAVDVVQCVAQNAEDLWNKCKPFEDNDEGEDEHGVVYYGDDVFVTAGAPTPPTRKPTHKPTHKPTKKPTSKPTSKPTGKPTKAPTGTKSPSGTKVPTAKAVFDAIALTLPYESSESVEEEDWPEMEQVEASAPNRMDNVEDFPNPMNQMHGDHMHGHHKHHRTHGHAEEPQMMMMSSSGGFVDQVTSVEIDMDSCVRSARKYCSKEVTELNTLPFDSSLMQALNYCIEKNANLIEAECVTSSSETVTFFPQHAPCRHEDDMTSNLPLCKKHHKCSFHHHGHALFGIAMAIGTLLVTIKAVLVCRNRRRKCCQAKHSTVTETRTVGGIAYAPIKSDNAPAVPANIV